MANTILQVKKSGVTGNVPPSLAYGELALNYADGKLYYKAANGSITFIQSGDGSTTDSFATINANSSLILATSPTDTLSIIPGNNITISTDTIGKSITINSNSTVDEYARDVNDTQNTDIIAVNQFAQAAFNQANTSSGSANLSSILYTLYSAPIGDYGLVTDSLYSDFGEYVAVEYDCRSSFPAGNGLLINDWNLT